MGSDSTLTYRVVEYEPGRRVVLEGGNDHVRTRDEITVTADEQTTGETGRGAQVTYTVTVQLRGVARVGEPLLSTVVDKIADDGQQHMRTVLEARVPRRRA